MDARQSYDEVYAYAMGRGRERFILQHVADAFAAQTATGDTTPIGILFPVLGLYLHVEKGWSGLRVQQVHMQLAPHKKAFPAVPLPRDRGRMTVVDVLAAPEGDERDRAIDAWCESVWTAFADSRPVIVELLRKHHVLHDEP